MKTLKFLLPMLAFILLCTSCTKEDITPTGGNVGVGIGPVYVQVSWGNPSIGIYNPGGGYYYGNANEAYFVGYIKNAPGGVGPNGQISTDVLIQVYASDGITPLCIVDCKNMFYKTAQRFLAIANGVSWPPGMLRPVLIHKTGTDYQIGGV